MGSGALPGKMMLVTIFENDKFLMLILAQVRLALPRRVKIRKIGPRKFRALALAKNRKQHPLNLFSIIL